jgi:hypothetical protein
MHRLGVHGDGVSVPRRDVGKSGGGDVVNTARAQKARRQAARARLERAVARHRAADPAERARRDEIAQRLRQVGRALTARRMAVKAVADAERGVAEATGRLVELGVPVARVAAQVDVPAAALRKTLRAHLMSRADSGEVAVAGERFGAAVDLQGENP